MNVRKTRANIDDAAIQELYNSITEIIKIQHKSECDDAYTILETKIKKIVQDKNEDPFRKYYELLAALNAFRIMPMVAKDIFLYDLSVQLLIKNISQQEEANWDQGKLLSDDMHEPIQFCLAQLSNATLYESLEHQLFAKKWHVEAKMEDYPSWLYFLENLTYQFDENQEGTLLALLREFFGLAQSSQITDISDEIYGCNAVKKYRTKGYLENILSRAELEISSNGDDEKSERHIIHKIKEGDMYSLSLRELVNQFFHELEIWSEDNLVKACVDYMCKFYLKIIAYPDSEVITTIFKYNQKQSHIINKFIYPFIENLINPLLTIMGKEECFCFNFEMVKCKFEEEAQLILKKNITPVSEPKKNISESNIQLSLARYAVRLVWESVKVDAAMSQKISHSRALQQALSAAFLYHQHAIGHYHGDHGKKSTLLFITNLLKLNSSSRQTIQTETLRYLRGDDEYAHWFSGGGSNYHQKSRIAFMWDSGLFDEHKQRLLITQSIFSPPRNFADIQSETRRNLTEEVKSLSF